MKAPGFRPVTPNIQPSAELPRLFADPLRFNVGFFLALVVAALVFWLLFKTTIGFTIRAVGANPDAARYAGMSITRTIVLAMTLSGGLAGLAGASQVLGVDYWVGQGFSAGYGFDAIALALLGKSHPVRRRAGRAVVRLPAQRRHPHAVAGRHPDRHHLDHPGPGDRLRRRAGYHPLALSPAEAGRGEGRAEPRVGILRLTGRRRP